MEYFVTFTLLRSPSPQLFVAGDRAGGQGSFQKTITFLSQDHLQEQLAQAGFSSQKMEADQGSPILVSAEQLRRLGIITQWGPSELPQSED